MRMLLMHLAQFDKILSKAHNPPLSHHALPLQEEREVFSRMPRDFIKSLRKNLGISLSLALLAVCIGLPVSYLVLRFPAFSGRLDNFIYDAWIRTNAEPPENPCVAIADIDEASIRKMGQLPWPRTVLSELVSILFAQGARDWPRLVHGAGQIISFRGG